jgi:hypothetical protein
MHMWALYLLYALFTVIILLCITLCVVIGSYGVWFYFKKTMDDCNIFFNEYNSSSKKAIDKYGDCMITRAYLITVPLSNLTLFMLNLITMQNSKTILDDAMHLQLMIEIETSNHEKKMILIDKTNCINILTEFNINDEHVIIPIPIKLKHKHTLSEILDKTHDRVGKLKFFNWHIYKNNCHYFIKELIFQINNEFRSRYIKSPKKIKHRCNKLFCNELAMGLYHVMMFLYNFFQKYIINVKQHIVSKIINMV